MNIFMTWAVSRILYRIIIIMIMIIPWQFISQQQTYHWYNHTNPGPQNSMMRCGVEQQEVMICFNYGCPKFYRHNLSSACMCVFASACRCMHENRNVFPGKTFNLFTLKWDRKTHFFHVLWQGIHFNLKDDTCAACKWHFKRNFVMQWNVWI